VAARVRRARVRRTRVEAVAPQRRDPGDPGRQWLVTSAVLLTPPVAHACSRSRVRLEALRAGGAPLKRREVVTVLPGAPGRRCDTNPPPPQRRSTDDRAPENEQ